MPAQGSGRIDGSNCGGFPPRGSPRLARSTGVCRVSRRQAPRMQVGMQVMDRDAQWDPVLGKIAGLWNRTPFEPGNLRSGPRPWPGETTDSRNRGAIQPGEALVTQVARTGRRTVSLATRWFGRDQVKQNRSSRWSRRGGQLDAAATVGISGATAMSTAEPRLEPHVGWSLAGSPTPTGRYFGERTSDE